MFLGEYQHSLDAKGRVILPADFRDELAEGAVMVTGTSKCIAVYRLDEWERVQEEVRLYSKQGETELNAARAFFAGARPFTPDRQGRVAIPQSLRDYAGLVRDAVICGASTRIEIWDAERWAVRKAEGEAALAAAANLPGFGI